VRRDDRAILYFAGKTVKHEGELYLVTSDTDPARVADTALPSSVLVSYLERIEGAMTLLLVEGGQADAQDLAALAPDGTVVAAGDLLADRVRAGMGRGRADVDGDARVSASELSAWFGLFGTRTAGGAPGALPVIGE
jgi:hypothetical protein